jgi:hypothetical protein
MSHSYSCDGYERFHSRTLMTRREALRLGVFATTGLVLLDGLGFKALAADAPSSTASGKGKAKSVIQIWLWGGACHIDTFDPKPEAGNDYCGPFTKPIETNVKGIRINELLPLLALQADKYSLIRSMSHNVNAHETASYMVQTGRASGGRDVYPCAGAVVSLFKGYEAGYKGLIPPYIVMTKPQGRFSEAGFLGSRYKPFATGGDPGKDPFAVEGVVAEGISTERQRQRRELLHAEDALARALPGDTRLAASAQSEEQAYDLILGDAGKVFDLTQEQAALRDRYGRSSFGQSCLLARRLVERGVPYVTINYEGWDTHKQHFQTMRRKLPELDKGLATLLADLREHGLLDSTIVWCSGEFGRTPRVQWEAPWNGGRGHYGRVFSSLVAGGGFRGGQVLGSSDARGEEVKERPVAPSELIGGMYQLLGIDPEARLPHPQGEVVKAYPEPPDAAAPTQWLKEIT